LNPRVGKAQVGSDMTYGGLIAMIAPAPKPKLIGSVKMADRIIETHGWFCPVCGVYAYTVEGPDPEEKKDGGN